MRRSSSSENLQAYSLIKRALSQLFFFEFRDIFRNNYSTEHLKASRFKTYLTQMSLATLKSEYFFSFLYGT